MADVKVIKIFEIRTSQTCRKCNQRGTGRTQGLSVCKTGSEENVDRNASFKSLTMLLGYISKVGITMNIPIAPDTTD
ncbi:MAG TPA: zinc ribbon domain-containing protein [Nitrososphaeraceae archaeon]